MMRGWVLAVLLTLAACDKSDRSSNPVAGPEQAAFTGIYDHAVTLTDGKYLGEPFVPGGASRPSVTLLDTPRWQIDLNHDGHEETLVTLVESSGGSGSFVYLAVLPGHGQSHGSIEPNSVNAHLLGDRVELELLARSADGLLNVLTRPALKAAGAFATGLQRFEIAGSTIRPLTEMSGWLTFAHEVRELTPCDSEAAPLWVSETQQGELNAASDNPAGDPYAPVFVSVLGVLEAAPDAEFAADFSQQIRVAALQRREREGPACRLDLAGATFRALGEEPFWSLAVYAERLEFSTMSEGTTLFSSTGEAADVEWLLRDGVLTGRFAGVSETGQSLTLELAAQPCTDTMAGNRYAWQARLNIGERRLNGCALTPLAAGP